MANPVVNIVLTAIDKTKSVFGSVKGGLASIGGVASGIKSSFATLFAGLSTAYFVGQIKKAIDAMDEASKAAQAAGVSVENLSALQYAGGQAGLEDGQLVKGLAKLSSVLDDARGGVKATVETFARLQLDPTKFQSTDEALLAIAERFASMPDGINKTALAVDLFGEKLGPKLIPFLNQGRDGIQKLKDEAVALGVVLDGEAAKAAENFNDNLDRMKKAGDGLVITLANQILPGLSQVTDAMAQAAKDGGLLNAAWVGLGGLGAAIFTDDLLTNTQKLAKAQEELAKAADGARRAGIGDTGYITRKRAEVKALEEAVAAEKKAEEERRKQSKQTTDALARDNAEIVAERKKAVTEQIADADRLAEALRGAFSDSIKAESDYLKEAKKLREEANAPDAPQSGNVEAQAAANLDAITRMMRIQREASTASLDDIQAQAEALRKLAEALDDQSIKQEAIRASKLAEATANERAAATERERYQGLTQEQNKAAAQSAELKTQMDAIEKGATVDVKPGPGLQQVKRDLNEIVGLLNQIGDKPLAIGDSASGSPAQIADTLRRAAQQYGRRN